MMKSILRTLSLSTIVLAASLALTGTAEAKKSTVYGVNLSFPDTYDHIKNPEGGGQLLTSTVDGTIVAEVWVRDIANAAKLPEGDALKAMDQKKLLAALNALDKKVDNDPVEKVEVRNLNGHAAAVYTKKTKEEGESNETCFIRIYYPHGKKVWMMFGYADAKEGVGETFTQNILSSFSPAK